jgi:hypothetical protein
MQNRDVLSPSSMSEGACHDPELGNVLKVSARHLSASPLPTIHTSNPGIIRMWARKRGLKSQNEVPRSATIWRSVSSRLNALELYSQVTLVWYKQSKIRVETGMEAHWVALAKEFRDADEDLIKSVDDSINSLLLFVRSQIPRSERED